MWKFLLGYFPYESTRSERKALQADKGKEYGVLKSQWQSVSEDQVRTLADSRRNSSALILPSYIAQSGHEEEKTLTVPCCSSGIRVVSVVLGARGAIRDSAPELEFASNKYSYSDVNVRPEKSTSTKSPRPDRILSTSQAKKFAKFRERKSRVDKDVVRTDRTLPFYEGDENPNVEKLRDILITYSFYNFDLGYCQVRKGH